MWSGHGENRFIGRTVENEYAYMEDGFAANIADQMLPIYRRHAPRVRRPIHWCTRFDIEDAWGKLNPVYGLDHAHPGYALAEQLGVPHMVFIGSSHVHHLADLIRFPVYHPETYNTVLHYKAHHFVREAQFIGVGGLKWWTMDDELHGVFTSNRKREKYGNQWLQFVNSGMIPDVAIIINGCNDIDDFNNRIMDTCYWTGSKQFARNADECLDEWFACLKPVIVNALDRIQKLLPNTRLCYLPVTPRKWWHKKSRELANKIDHFISYRLRQEHNIKVMLIGNGSFFKDSHHNALQNVFNDVNPALLERDFTHYNIWGYEALIRDLVHPVMGYYKSLICG